MGLAQRTLGLRLLNSPAVQDVQDLLVGRATIEIENRNPTNLQGIEIIQYEP